MQNAIVNRIKDKERDRASLEEQISHVNLSHMDEREKNLVRMASVLHNFFFCLVSNNLVLLSK